MVEQTKLVDDFGLGGDNTENVAKTARPKTNSAKRRTSKAQKDRELKKGASPFSKNVGRYTKESVEQTDWDIEIGEPGTLPNVEALKEEGFQYCWIRTLKGDKEDISRINEAANQGWEPVTEDDVPESVSVPYVELDGGITAVGQSGLLLCRMPTNRWKALKQSEIDDAERQRNSIGSEIREVDSGGSAKPLKSIKERTRRGTRVQG